MLRSLAIILWLSSSALAGPKNSSFPIQFLAYHLLLAEGQILDYKESLQLAEVMHHPKANPSILERAAKIWQNKHAPRSLVWLGPLQKLQPKPCPQVVSVKCQLMAEFQESLSRDQGISFIEIMDRLKQNQHPIANEADLSLLYSALLVRHRHFQRALLSLYPTLGKDEQRIKAYEWIQWLYSASDRDSGQVAIKSP